MEQVGLARNFIRALEGSRVQGPGVASGLNRQQTGMSSRATAGIPIMDLRLEAAR